MMFLISGNCEGVVELLLRMLEENEGREEDVGQSLRLMMVDLVEKKKLDPDTMEQLLKSQADRKFFLSGGTSWWLTSCPRARLVEKLC